MPTARRGPRRTQPSRVALAMAASLAALFASFTGAETACAQTLHGAFVATVTDEQGGAIAGAQGRLSSPALIAGTIERQTNDRGQLRFPALPPGVYELEITMAGFTPVIVSNVEIGGGAVIERTLVLHPAGVAESVVVQGEVSRLTDRRRGFATRFDAEDLRTTPTRRTGMFDFIRAAPGISPTSPSSGTVTTVSAFGSGVNTNTFLIDGTNFTCPCLGTARAVPGTDFIQEVQVQSAGASAEFGNMQGAVINVITRQGGDRYEFDAGWYWQTAALTAQPVRLPVPGSGGRTTGYERVRYRDAYASAGGPLVRDRLWFFSGYQHLRDYDSQPGTDASAPRRFEQDKIVGKLTWRLAPGMTLFNSLHQESWVRPQPPTINRPFEATVRVRANVPTITFGHLTHTLSPDTVWDARVGQFWYSEEIRPSTGDLMAVSRLDVLTNVLSGAPPMFGDVHLGRTTAKATLTHYRTGPAGAEQELKVGGQIEQGRHDVSIIVPTGTRFIDFGGVPLQSIAQAPSRVGGEVVTAAAFVSDSIRLADSLTLSAGLRFEHNRASHPDLHGVDLVGETTGEVFRGAGTLYTWNVLSPRLGLTKKLDADGRTVLRASYGRYYQGVLTAELDMVHPGATPSVTTVLANGTVIVEDPRTIFQIDPETRAPRTDEFSAAIDRQLGGGLAVAVAYVHKRGRDAIGWSDVAGVYREETRTLANGMRIPVFALDTSITPPGARRFLLTNQDYPLQYHGLVVAFEKRRTDWWQAFGSYTLSRAYGLQVFSPGTTAGEQTSTVAPVGGPLGRWGRDPNDLINARGRLANDRPHALRLMASVHEPRTGLLLAANLQHFSGKPWAATTVVSLPQNQGQRILLEPRGSRRLSAQTLLDLRVSRTLYEGRRGRLELLVDVLNALNDAAEEGIANDTLATLTETSVEGFGRPNAFVDPRRAMLGLRLTFGDR